MNKTINPFDLGELQLIDRVQKIDINHIVRSAYIEYKKRFVESTLEALGTNIRLTISKTRFNGTRLWFMCPKCNKRVGTLFKHPVNSFLACRICLKLKYRKQRFKGMFESQY